MIDGKLLFVCKELSWLVPQCQIAINCYPKYEAIYWEWKLGNMLFYMFWIYGRLINSNNNNNKTKTLCLMCIHIYADRSKAIWHIKKLLKFFVVLFRECFIFFHIYIYFYQQPRLAELNSHIGDLKNHCEQTQHTTHIVILKLWWTRKKKTTKKFFTERKGGNFCFV